MSNVISARKVKGGTVTLMEDDGGDLWSVNIYKGTASLEYGKYGEWMSGRTFQTRDAAVEYFRICVK